MPARRSAANGVVCRCDSRGEADGGFELFGGRGERRPRGGRFGSHSSNESIAPVFFRKLAFVTWFNAGVRAIDIRDPYHPKEVGYFIPAVTEATDKRCIKIDGKDVCKVAIQSNNVETDERGYVYVVDRAGTGLHILEVTGPARAIAGWPIGPAYTGDSMGTVAALIAGIGLCLAAALSFCVVPGLQNTVHAMRVPDRAVWVEGRWPFPMDQWGEG